MLRDRLLLALLALGCVSEPAEAPPAQAAQPLVALVSIGGFTPAALAPRAGGDALLPTVARFAAHGARAERTQPAFPPSTYPAHATLVSGVAPARHGIVADRRLDERGVSGAFYSAASGLRVRPLWQAVGEAALPVAALDWPTTQGAAIALLLPDVTPGPGQSWLDRLRESAAPSALVALVEQRGGSAPGAARPGAARDAVLVGVACELVAAPRPPRLLLLRLSQTSEALAAHGPDSPEAVRAFAGADRELTRWLHCLRDARRLDSASVFVVGDHGFGSVHTAIAPNVALSSARLLVPAAGGGVSWEVIARSSGGSAFVYAKNERAALRARDVLDREARETGAFRVLTAEEMLRAGGDPEAWFGLEAEPGYAFEDAATGALLRAAAVRGVGGYVSAGPALDPGFAAWGRGIRRGIRIPLMRQTDVAPTLARLLGVPLEEAEGRALVGLFESDAAAPSVGAPQ